MAVDRRPLEISHGGNMGLGFVETRNDARLGSRRLAAADLGLARDGEVWVAASGS
ncbi:hypothetical protein TIFTF001_029086 [Ficus carica]|uniref:Uncharacterized protein n=1 Tax=Ficus carica TaxID=3494 RepID=A0AA88J1Z5_FICCA|nr:hypothetical protein TIFTF001_029086 [Ficus carica]